MQTFNELRDREEDRISFQFKAAIGIMGGLIAVAIFFCYNQFLIPISTNGPSAKMRWGRLFFKSELS